MNEHVVGLPDEQATIQLGSRLADVLVEGLVVYLSGDLGAGKTCLVRGMLQGLGHIGPVKSPTYTLVEDYVLGDSLIYHFDLYRLLDPEELELIGIRDYFNGKACCFVEWPERGKGWLPAPDIEIHIRLKNEGREASLTGLSETGAALVASLKRD